MTFEDMMKQKSELCIRVGLEILQRAEQNNMSSIQETIAVLLEIARENYGWTKNMPS